MTLGDSLMLSVGSSLQSEWMKPYSIARGLAGSPQNYEQSTCMTYTELVRLRAAIPMENPYCSCKSPKSCKGGALSSSLRPLQPARFYARPRWSGHCRRSTSGRCSSRPLRSSTPSTPPPSPPSRRAGTARAHRAHAPHTTRSDPLQIVLTRACLCGRGACADCTLKSAALIKTNPTEWFLTARPAGVRPDSSDPELQHRELHLRGQLPQPVSRHWHARHGLSSDKMALITSDCGTPP